MRKNKKLKRYGQKLKAAQDLTKTLQERYIILSGLDDKEKGNLRQFSATTDKELMVINLALSNSLMPEQLKDTQVGRNWIETKTLNSAG